VEVLPLSMYATRLRASTFNTVMSDKVSAACDSKEKSLRTDEEQWE